MLWVFLIGTYEGNDMVSKIDEAINALNARGLIALTERKGDKFKVFLIAEASGLNLRNLEMMLELSKGAIFLALEENSALLANLSKKSHSEKEMKNVQVYCPIGCKANPYTSYTPLGKLHVIKTLCDEQLSPSDILFNGYIYPVSVPTQGVLKNKGAFEGAVDLLKIIKQKPIAVVCPVIHKGSDILSEDELNKFAKDCSIVLLDIQDIVDYRVINQILVHEVIATKLPLDEYGEFKMVMFHNEWDQLEHFVLYKPQMDQSKTPIVRVHSECLTGDLLGSLRCDCGPQLHYSLKLISNEGGLLIYLRQEGRGIGLVNKLKAYTLQDLGEDTVEANISLGLPVDNRDYAIAYQFLKHFNIQKIRLLTNNPEKITQLEKLGIHIKERLPILIKSNPFNRAYLETKKGKLGHLI